MGDTYAGEGDEARPTGSRAGESPKEMAASAAQTVKQEAASFVADARDKAVEKVEQQKETASQTLGDFANAIRRAGDELAQSDQSMATRLVRQAADGLEGLARSVSDKRPEDLLEAARDFGRRNPTAFIAGSVLAGIAIGRFLKSSSTSENSDSGANARASFDAAPELGLSEARAVDPTTADAPWVRAQPANLGAEESSLKPAGDPLEGPEAQATASSGEVDRSRNGAGS
jgi:hypothetical protein